MYFLSEYLTAPGMAGMPESSTAASSRAVMVLARWAAPTELFKNERISTTQTRAKEASREAEKMITLAKRGDLHARRQVLSYVYDEDVVTKLFDDIANRYDEREGGYTRILKLEPRRGDGHNAKNTNSL